MPGWAINTANFRLEFLMPAACGESFPGQKPTGDTYAAAIEGTNNR
jgi:hypothetical protein